jgi:hypothetical protein
LASRGRLRELSASELKYLEVCCVKNAMLDVELVVLFTCRGYALWKTRLRRAVLKGNEPLHVTRRHASVCLQRRAPLIHFLLPHASP